MMTTKKNLMNWNETENVYKFSIDDPSRSFFLNHVCRVKNSEVGACICECVGVGVCTWSDYEKRRENESVSKSSEWLRIECIEEGGGWAKARNSWINLFYVSQIRLMYEMNV